MGKLLTMGLILLIAGCASTSPEGQAAMSTKMKSLGEIQTKAQVIEMFAGKTVDISAVNGKKYRLKHGINYTISGTFPGKWSVKDDGTKCISHKRGTNCVTIVKTPDGEVIAVEDGKKVSTFKF